MTQATHHRKKNQAPAIVAITLISGWAVLLGIMLLTGLIHWLAALAALWLSYNFVSWLVPQWRLAILERRGTTVGLGYAIAGGLVSTLPVMTNLGLFQILGTIMLNTFLLYLPFFAVQWFRVPPGRPHWIDIILAAYIFSIAHLCPGDGPLVAGTTMQLGGFIALATTVTLFYGQRFWNRSKWELTIGKKHQKVTALCIVVVGSAAWIDRVLELGSGPLGWINTVYKAAVIAPLLALLVFGIVQFAVREVVRARGLKLAEWAARVAGAVLFIAVWVTTGGNIGLTCVAVGVCGAYLAQKTQSISSVGLITVLGFVLNSVV